MIYLFVGGFALATALVRHGLDRWLTMAVLQLAGGRQAAAIGLLFVLTARLSVWLPDADRPDLVGAGSPFELVETRGSRTGCYVAA
ncbi:MAG: hypothetical protein WA210_16080 [Burkholderiaceae bacterium]